MTADMRIYHEQNLRHRVALRRLGGGVPLEYVEAVFSFWLCSRNDGD